MGWFLSEALTGLGTSLISLADEVLDNCLALEYLLAEQGRVCAIIDTSCCTWINGTGQVKVNMKEIYAPAEWLHNSGGATLPPLSGQQLRKPKVSLAPSLSRPLMAIVVLLLSPCLFNLLVKFVSFKLQQFEVRLMMAQGVQPIPVESGPGPYRSSEQSVRDLYSSRVG